MRFMSNNMLTTQEIQCKDEIIDFTEQVLDARGLECDGRISKLSEEKLKEILEEIKTLRSSKRRRKRIDDDHDLTEEDDGSNKKEVLYINR
jgi:hypothetical protein